MTASSCSYCHAGDHRSTALLAAAGLTCLLAACAPVAPSSSPDSGSAPTLPAPQRSLLPTVNIAPARGWPSGVVPRAAAGTRVGAFASDLDHPRWLHVLPNGDVLVAETNAPANRAGSTGLKARVMGWIRKRAGAGVPSANRITLLRDTDDDGVADLRAVLLDGLNSPFGIQLVGEHLYVANTDALLRYPYATGDTRIEATAHVVAALPAGEINHHWTKSLIASADGERLYVGVGSNSNVAERGMAVEEGRAAIWEIDPHSGATRLFASGLRNPNGMAWEPGTGALWTVVNERDELGNDLVPDYLTRVRDGAFYGWPYSYFGAYVDARVKPPRPDRVALAVVPDYALGAHVAPLGLAWSASNRLPARFAQGMFIGQHGSWNRRPHSGYSVIFVPFVDGRPSGESIDVLTGFLSPEGDAWGRPVGVALDRSGALLVADDVGNIIWRVSGE